MNNKQELRKKFFDECTVKDSVDGTKIRIDYAPHDLFEWFWRASLPAEPSTPETKDKPEIKAIPEVLKLDGAINTYKNLKPDDYTYRNIQSLFWSAIEAIQKLISESAQKDKPATGNGGGGDEGDESYYSRQVLRKAKDLIDHALDEMDLENDFCQHVLKNSIAIVRCGCECDDYNGFDCGCTQRSVITEESERECPPVKLATLRQPVGTVYEKRPLTELPDKDDWYCVVAERAVPLVRWYDSENGWDIPDAESGYKHYLSPIQFLPEREGAVKRLGTLTDAEKLEVAKILGGASHISEESQIFQVEELLKNRYSGQTNIPGIRWYRAWKYLESRGYEIDGLNV